MVMRVQRVDGEYRIVLSEEAMEALHLADGAEVELRPVAEKSAGTHVEYVPVQEALDSYERTGQLHRNTYRDLAK